MPSIESVLSKLNSLGTQEATGAECLQGVQQHSRRPWTVQRLFPEQQLCLIIRNLYNYSYIKLKLGTL